MKGAKEVLNISNVNLFVLISIVYSFPIIWLVYVRNVKIEIHVFGVIKLIIDPKYPRIRPRRNQNKNNEKK